jgi:hypothetical protein
MLEKLFTSIQGMDFGHIPEDGYSTAPHPRIWVLRGTTSQKIGIIYCHIAADGNRTVSHPGI